MKAPEGPAIYRTLARAQLARLLSLLDREPFSKTYGCFDRVYWGWKFTDFPGARFQEGIYSLAYCYTQPFEGNPLASNPHTLTWIRAALAYWQRIQYGDGSFDEAYPFEHSLAATAFTGFYVGEAFLRLAEHLPANEQTSLQITFARAGDWLCRNDEQHGVLSNHLAAAAVALQVIYQITGIETYRQRANHFLERIYRHQSAPEGWYEEYGGADPGYQTHTTFYLARLWQHTQDDKLLDSLKTSLVFLKYFIHPNGTLGGEYASRNTEFYMPAGFEILAPVCPDAALIARRMRPTVADQTGVGLAAMDSYNFFPLLNNYLFAADHASQLSESAETLTYQQTGQWVFSEAGIVVKSTPTYYAILGLAKGGMLRVYNQQNQQLQVSDCGYWARLANGKVASSQSLTQTPTWQEQGEQISLQTDFVQVNQRIFSPWLFINFRLVSLVLGRVPVLAYWLKNMLVAVLVKRRKSTPLQLQRTVTFGVDSVHLTDKISAPAIASVYHLQRQAKFATIHMGSSRYFQAQELETPPLDTTNLAAQLDQHGVVELEQTWSFNNNEEEAV